MTKRNALVTLAAIGVLTAISAVAAYTDCWAGYRFCLSQGYNPYLCQKAYLACPAR